MKECKNSDILPCYRDGYGVWHHLDDIHDKVYKLNKQMCDLGKTMNDPLDPISEESIQEIAKALEITRNPKSIMEEKKTKTMTKAEAFEYLKMKKIKCYAGIANIFDEPTKVEKFLLEIGCRYHFANHVGWRDWYWPLYGFIVDSEGEIYVVFENQIDFFKQSSYEEISVDDILSIEIVEEKKVLSVDCALEHAKWIMKYLREECSPHTKMIIEGDHAELVEGVKSVVWKE